MTYFIIEQITRPPTSTCANAPINFTTFYACRFAPARSNGPDICRRCDMRNVAISGFADFGSAIMLDVSFRLQQTNVAW